MSPTTIGRHSPAVTATITSSSSATPRAVSPSRIRARPRPCRASNASCGSPKRSPIRAASANVAWAAAASPCEDGLERRGQEQVALLHAVAAGVVEQPLAARSQPAAPGPARRSAAAATPARKRSGPRGPGRPGARTRGAPAPRLARSRRSGPAGARRRRAARGPRDRAPLARSAAASRAWASPGLLPEECSAELDCVYRGHAKNSNRWDGRRPAADCRARPRVAWRTARLRRARPRCKTWPRPRSMNPYARLGGTSGIGTTNAARTCLPLLPFRRTDTCPRCRAVPAGGPCHAMRAGCSPLSRALAPTRSASSR